MNTIAISIKNLTKKLNNIVILNNISLNVFQGDICGIIGRNASGKSMLFKCITNLTTYNTGSIEIYNENIQSNEYKNNHIGALIEYPGFLPNYSGLTNLKLLGMIRGIITEDEIVNSMRLLELDPEDRRSVRKYSIGMRQKLGIVAAIMERPKILILDEPTNNIDLETVDLFRKIMIDLNKKYDTTILIASHNMEDIEAICTKKFRIDKGTLIELDG